MPFGQTLESTVQFSSLQLRSAIRKPISLLFAISCTKARKSNYLNSNGEEAQEKPLAL